MEHKDISRRNFFFLTMEGTFILFAIVFVDPNSIVPVFVDTFSGSILLAGLANTLRLVFMVLPAVIIGPFIQKAGDMAVLTRLIMLIFRPLFLLMVPVLLLVKNPHTASGIFLVIYSLYCISEGLVYVPWWELFSRTIPNERRGRLLGYQQFFAGIGGITGGIAIKFIFGNPGLPDNIKFAVIFGIAGIMSSASACMMIPVRDFPRETAKQRTDLSAYFRRLPGYAMKSWEFKRLSLVQLAGGIGVFAVPFLVLFGKDVYNFGPSQVSNLIFLQITGSLAGGLLWGTMSHRAGNRRAVILTQFISIVINITALASYFDKLIFIPYVIILLAGINMGSWLGVMNYLIEAVNEEDRPVYLLLNNMIGLPLSVLPSLAGLIAGGWGYLPLFIAGSAGAICALALAFTLRNRKTAGTAGESGMEKG